MRHKQNQIFKAPYRWLEVVNAIKIGESSQRPLITGKKLGCA
jgi:hypothetical protein